MKKQTLQLTELNEKLNEYIEKYTRQAAYISQVHTKIFRIGSTKLKLCATS